MKQSTSSVDILRELVAFDTTSHGSNLALIGWIEEYLSRHGVWHQRVQEHQENGIGKTSLIARIGPDIHDGLVLSGHTDVVPVSGQQWAGGQGADTAFTLTERAGKFYGRGTADMKGFIALVLAAVPALVEKKLARPVWIALSHDEEIGCKCAVPMALEFTARHVRPALIIVGEPTGMQVVDEHKGIDSFLTVIRGRAGHSSAPELGINAGYLMAELALCLRDINEAQRACSDPDSRFPTPHSTVHVGVFHSGTARNIIPDHAELRFEVRPLPGVDTASLLAPYESKIVELLKQYPGSNITTERLMHVHGLKCKGENTPHLALAMFLAGSNADTAAVSYGTEGGAYGEYGFPTVICGPGSIDQAHGADEFISRDQLEKGAAMLARIVAWARDS